GRRESEAMPQWTMQLENQDELRDYGRAERTKDGYSRFWEANSDDSRIVGVYLYEDYNPLVHFLLGDGYAVLEEEGGIWTVKRKGLPGGAPTWELEYQRTHQGGKRLRVPIRLCWNGARFKEC